MTVLWVFAAVNVVLAVVAAVVELWFIEPKILKYPADKTCGRIIWVTSILDMPGAITVVPWNAGMFSNRDSVAIGTLTDMPLVFTVIDPPVIAPAVPAYFDEF